MPVNRRFPLKSLMNACRSFPQSRFRRITFEYILMKGINDTKEDAARLSELLKGMKAKVNIIQFNRHPAPRAAAAHFEPSPQEAVLSFRKALNKAGITATIRRSLGGDIAAACGQLRADYK